MKKALSLLLALVLCLSLCACGNNGTAEAENNNDLHESAPNIGQITTSDIIGTWHDEKTQQVITVSANEAWLFQYPNGAWGSTMRPEVENNQIIIHDIGTFDIEVVNGELKIICATSEMIAKDTAFVKCEEITSLEEITGHSWVNLDTGFTLTFTDGFYIHTTADGYSSTSSFIQSSCLAGNIYYMPGIDIFKIVTEGDSFKLVGETLGEYITQEDAREKLKNELVSIGETAKTELFEITVTEYEFADLLGKDNTTRLFARDISWDDPGDEKVFMIIKFDYVNLDKRAIDMVYDLCVTVDYKDGYEYASFTEDKAYIFEDDTNGVFRRCSLDTGGYAMELSPLTSDSYFVAIPVAKVVSTDTESTIIVRFDYGENIKGGVPVSESVCFKIR